MKPLAHLEIQYIKTDELLEYPSNAKLHPSDQIDQIAASIEEFNFNNPILAWHNDDGEPEIVAGHGRLMAARKLGLRELPVVFLDHMTEEQRRAYIIVDNSES
jgi:ParB-like chromosome segregation protein Spo0J